MNKIGLRKRYKPDNVGLTGAHDWSLHELDELCLFSDDGSMAVVLLVGSADEEGKVLSGLVILGSVGADVHSSGSSVTSPGTSEHGYFVFVQMGQAHM